MTSKLLVIFAACVFLSVHAIDSERIGKLFLEIYYARM